MAPKKKPYNSAPNLSMAAMASRTPTRMGHTPASLLNRNNDRKDSWCPKSEIEFDPYCDPQNPKTITYKEIEKAVTDLSESIPRTPLRKSRCSELFGVELYYKLETFYKTGSFNERGARNVLLSLSQQEQDAGVICASIGNFGMALAYHARKLSIKSKIVYPIHTPEFYVNKVKEFGGKVILTGTNLTEARHEAFVIARDAENVFINGYDHPAVIAGSGTIGVEIMEDLPEVDAILVPIGGGGLIAGIAEAAKHYNPDVLIYGIEPDKCCSFFKAMEKDGIFETEVGRGVAETLGVPMAGCNAFHTAKSLISKMVLVDDDWIARAIAHIAEEEKMVVEGAGATSLAALFAMPNILPELLEKNVVCILTGSNIHDVMTIPKCLDRARAIDGRLIKLTMHIDGDDTKHHTHVMSMIANTGCNVIQCHTEHAWITDNDLWKIRLHLMIETRDLEHACTLKRVMLKLFPDQCDFMEEPFSPIPICVCYPKKKSPFAP